MKTGEKKKKEWQASEDRQSAGIGLSACCSCYQNTHFSCPTKADGREEVGSKRQRGSGREERARNPLQGLQGRLHSRRT